MCARMCHELCHELLQAVATRTCDNNNSNSNSNSNNNHSSNSNNVQKQSGGGRTASATCWLVGGVGRVSKRKPVQAIVCVTRPEQLTVVQNTQADVTQ